MNNLISLLESIANDASLSNGSTADNLLESLLENSALTNKQRLAIQTKNTDLLIESTTDLPLIKCFAIATPDSNEDTEESTESSPQESDSQASAFLSIAINC